MNKLVTLAVLSLAFTGISMANDVGSNGEQHHKKCEASDEACKAKRKEFREERRKKFLEEKCHGDQACEAKMKQKFEEKRAAIKAEMAKCPEGDHECRKAARQKAREEFKEKRKEQKQERSENRSAAPSRK